MSRLRDMFTAGCYFSTVSGFPFEPISRSDQGRSFPQKCGGLLRRRERRALPVCRHAALGGFTNRHARLHVQAVLDEIVGRAAFADASSGTGRLLLRRLLLRLSCADNPEPPDDHQQLSGATAALAAL